MSPKRKSDTEVLKIFNDKYFNNDVSQIPFHSLHAFDDIDDIYWDHEVVLNYVLNDNAPIKKRKAKPSKPPNMN